MLPPAAPLFGREAELARLIGLAQRAREGEAQVVVLSGDAGMGKTRLLTELIDRVGDGVMALAGGCIDTGGAPLPLLPLIALLRQLPGQVGRDGAAELLERFPDLLPLTRAGFRAPDGSDDHEATRLYGAVLDLVGELATVRPVVLAIEDLHWGDASTLALFVFLASSLDSDRVLLVGSYREHELHRRHPLRQVLAGVQRLRSATMIDLQPLDRLSIEALVGALIGERPSPVELDVLLERAEGNPFFTEQLVSAGRAGRAGPLPRSIEALLLARVEGLPDSVLDTLRVFAACRFDAPIELLAAATGASVEVVEDSLRAAIETRLLDTGPSGEPRFRHTLLAEAVERTLLASERRRLHVLIAEHLAAHPPSTDEGTYTALLAHHWLAAGRAAPAFHAALAAAGADAYRHAPAAVHQHLHTVLDLWDQVDDAEQLANASLYEILTRAATAAEGAGLYDEAASLARRAVHEAAAGGDRTRQLLAAEQLERTLYLGGDLEAARSLAVQLADELDAATPTVEPVAIVAINTARAGSLLALGEYAGALPKLPGIIELAASIPDRARVAELTNLYGCALAGSGDYEGGLRTLREAKAIALAEGLEDAYCVAASNEHLAMRVTRNLEVVLEAAQDAAAFASSRSVSRSRQLGIYTDLAETLFRLGRWAEAERALSAAPRGTLWVDTSAAALLGAGLAMGRGDLAFAVRVVEHGDLANLAMFPPNALIVSMMRVHLALARGEPERALRIVEDALDEALEVSVVHHGLEAAALGAEAAWRLGGAAGRARPLLERAESALSVLATGDPTAQGFGWHALARAWIGWMDGPASAEWSAAVAALDAAHLAVEAAKARIRWAQAMLATGERDGASALLAAARPVLAGAGAAPLLAEIDDLIRRARLRVGAGLELPAQRDGATAYGLTEREVEVLALVAEGLTNGEIGERLYISTKTVSVHVSNLLRKLQVESRRQAGRLAREAGLVN